MSSSKANWLVLTMVAAAIFGFFAYANFIEPRQLVVNAQDLPVIDLDPAFDGLKIVAIGDIHGGSNYVTEQRLREIVELANAQQPDIVVLLGDYVAHDVGSSAIKMPIRAIADGLLGLKARYGVFAVLGNHDGWYDDASVSAELTRVGYRVLENEVATVEVNGASLRLLGLKDHMKLAATWNTISKMVRNRLAGSSGQVFVLEHSPDILPTLTEDPSDIKLVLAAHTHGGQISLPVFGPPFVPSSYGQKYAAGHVREHGVDMFVTTGIGTSILPLRFWVPPEIAVLTLRAG